MATRSRRGADARTFVESIRNREPPRDGAQPALGSRDLLLLYYHYYSRTTTAEFSLAFPLFLTLVCILDLFLLPLTILLSFNDSDQRINSRMSQTYPVVARCISLSLLLLLLHSSSTSFSLFFLRFLSRYSSRLTAPFSVTTLTRLLTELSPTERLPLPQR